MGIDQRRYPRYEVKLAVRYATASEFVNDYVENLSQGGLFIAGAKLDMFQITVVHIELPGSGKFMVTAKAVFILDEAMAAKMNRRPGVGLEMIEKPPGFEDALLGYLLRLGRRRDHELIVGDVPGGRFFADAGFRVVASSSNALAAVIGASDADPAVTCPVFRVEHVSQLPDILERLDGLL
jgi:Tfp pilus assembly protein PilZ